MSGGGNKRARVYFISHGVSLSPSLLIGLLRQQVIADVQGPPTLFDTASKPYQAWKTIGQSLIRDAPKGIVVVSAHWEKEGGGKGVKGRLTHARREREFKRC